MHPLQSHVITWPFLYRCLMIVMPWYTKWHAGWVSHG